MKKSTKAALFSGLVFPGAGQIFLGRRRRGWAFIVAVILIFAYVVIHITMRAYREIAAAAARGDAIDMPAIQKTVAANSDTAATVAFGLLVVIWIAAVLDAFIAGRRLESSSAGQEDRRSSKPLGDP